MGSSGEVDGPDLTEGVPLSQLEEGNPFVGTVDGEPVVVVKKDESLYAIGARCTHYGGPLEEGLVVGDTIRCPWHHAVFDLKTGEAKGAPAFGDTGCYPVEIDGFHFRVLTKEESPKARPSVDGPESVVIVGAGAAAASAAETLRKEGFDGAITMVGADEEGPVDRPNLSKDYLAGEAPDEWIPLGGDDHWRQLEVEVLRGDPVVDIDRQQQRIRTESGTERGYDRLLYATGAEPLTPPIGGLESTRHYTLRSYADSQAIVEAAEQGEAALVIGASFIGLEVAASLRQRGIEVTVVAPESRPLGMLLGDELGALVESVHRDRGVEFHLGAKVEEFDGGTAKLSDAAEIPFDFVVLGVGVRPRTEVAEAAGLDVSDGVNVDRQLTTNDAAIYAAGDVARYPDPISGQSVRIEHWVVAQRQAQTAARNILGGSAEEFSDVPFFWSRHFDLTIRYIGHAPDFDDISVDGSIDDRDATVGYLRDGEVLAVATVGRDLDGLRAETALARGDQGWLRDLVGAD